jgi:Arc/MetJ-type ribon-helix-helix transcriptional regulator
MVASPASLMIKRYRNVSIPEELYLELEKLVQSDKGGYVSVSDAVKDSLGSC